MRKLFPGTFLDFKFGILENQPFSKMSARNVHLLPVSGLPPGCVWSVLPAALRRPQKKHALDFWSMYLMLFCHFKRFQDQEQGVTLGLSGGATRNRGDLRSEDTLYFRDAFQETLRFLPGTLRDCILLTNQKKTTTYTRYMLQNSRAVFFLRSPKRRRQPPTDAQGWET